MDQGIGTVRRRRPPLGGCLASLLVGAALAGGMGPAGAAQAGCAVPDVSGATVERAKQRIQRELEAKRLRYTIKVDPPAAEQRPDRARVVAQDVVGCRDDQPSRSVTVYLAARAEVPDVVGQTRREAGAILDRAGLVAYFDPQGTGDVVVGQAPEPGTRAIFGSRVDLRLGQGTGTTGPSTGTGGGTGGTGGSRGPDGERAGDTATASTGPGGVWWVLGALVIVLVTGGAVSGRRLVTRRSSRRPSRAPGRVHAEPHGDPVPDVSASADPAGRSLTVRLQPHGDQGTQWLGDRPP
jgi:hypothetical protein